MAISNNINFMLAGEGLTRIWGTTTLDGSTDTIKIPMLYPVHATFTCRSAASIPLITYSQGAMLISASAGSVTYDFECFGNG